MLTFSCTALFSFSRFLFLIDDAEFGSKNHFTCYHIMKIHPKQDYTINIAITCTLQVKRKAIIVFNVQFHNTLTP